MPSRFETVAAELAALGVTIAVRPGEYVLNYRHGKDDTARFADDLDEALELGRELAVARAGAGVQLCTSAHDPAVTPRRRRTMTAKAMRRRFIKRHNRRLRARALRDQAAREGADDE